MVRWLKHVLVPDWALRRRFSKEALERIGAAIAASERLHRGELCFAVEATLPLAYLRTSVRARAEDLFASLRAWDTEENSGVLLYVQLVDRDIEIVADRGIAARVAAEEWEAICRAMEEAFRRNDYLGGALGAIERVSALLARHFPALGVNPNEIPDRPTVL